MSHFENHSNAMKEIKLVKEEVTKTGNERKRRVRSTHIHTKNARAYALARVVSSDKVLSLRKGQKTHWNVEGEALNVFDQKGGRNIANWQSGEGATRSL